MIDSLAVWRMILSDDRSNNSLRERMKEAEGWIESAAVLKYFRGNIIFTGNETDLHFNVSQLRSD